MVGSKCKKIVEGDKTYLREVRKGHIQDHVLSRSCQSQQSCYCLGHGKLQQQRQPFGKFKGLNTNQLQHVKHLVCTSQGIEACASLKEIIFQKRHNVKRLKRFLESWKFLQQSCQEKIPGMRHMNREKKEQVQLEVEDILRKGVISICQHREGEFLSNLFLVGNRDVGHLPIINLKCLSNFLLY